LSTSSLLCRLCLVASSWVWLVGCERITRARQCAALVESVNGSMQAIRGAAEAGLSPALLETSADHYSALAESLGPMQFNDLQMALDVESFRRSLTQAAELCRELASAKAKNERAQAALLKRDLEALKAPMKTSAYKMNSWCAEP
jgi:hypothetical protein